MALPPFVVKSSTEVRDDFLRTIKNGLIARGIASPNVSPGSDWYVLASALGNELAVVGANAVVKADEQMPDSSTADGLTRIAAIWALTKQPAAGAVGFAAITSSATSTITTGQELIDENGQRYGVVVGGSFANADYVLVAAIDVGRSTNKAEGDVLKWVVSPPYCDEKVTVGPGGLVNGINAEDDEALRSRLFSLLQNPPASGNWEHCAEIAEASDPRVQKAFVGPAALGPATMRIAVTAAPTLTSKERDVDSTVMSSIVEPFIVGSLPEHSAITVTTVDNTLADVAIGLSLPEARTANPPGPGGGWTNGTPWPTPDMVSYWNCTVTAVTSTTVFTVDAQTAPISNVSRIAWLSPIDWKLRTALVTGSSGSAGAYVITIDTPFAGIATGHYIWPECQNAALYCEALLAQFALIGPGEFTDNASALLRGFRHPVTSNGWPNTLGPHLLNALTRARSEVQSAQFSYRAAAGHTPISGTAGSLSPDAPAAIADAPLIFVPQNIGFYRIP